MRKITRDAANAFVCGQPFNRDNTAVIVNDRRVSMLLHGNLIAQFDLSSGVITGTLAGWGTPATRERLNGITDWIGCDRFYQKDHAQWFGGQPIDLDEWVTLYEPQH